MRRKGFTLIELLVVIAIIAILAAILFPVFAKAREKARQSSCLSNVKQLTLGLMQYVQDYDEKFPGRYAVTVYPDYVYTGQRWDNVIMPYVKNTQVKECPSRQSTSEIDYGYNTVSTNGYPLGTGATLAGIDKPASIVMILDSDRAPTAYQPASYNWTDWSSYYPGLHNDGVNCGFVDGHVKWYKPATLWNNQSNTPYFTD